jgi:DNA-binding MarR family transcriptional regulator
MESDTGISFCLQMALSRLMAAVAVQEHRADTLQSQLLTRVVLYMSMVYNAPANPQPSARAELSELMRRMGETMRRRFHQVVSEHGLTPPMYAMIRELKEPIPMSFAAERLCFDASYITGLADRLEALGLVERRPDPGDRRVKQLALTDRGIEVTRRIDEEMALGPGLFPELVDEDVSDLVRIYRKLLPEPG